MKQPDLSYGEVHLPRTDFKVTYEAHPIYFENDTHTELTRRVSQVADKGEDPPALSSKSGGQEAHCPCGPSLCRCGWA